MTVSSSGDGLVELVQRYRLERDARARLQAFLDLLLADPLAPTSIRTREAALDDHLADSLVALELPALRDARTVLDLGSGAGLPGLPLAVALPGARFTLLESSARKCQFMRRAAEATRLVNVEVIQSRAETLAGRGERFDVVTARAVAPLPVTLEYAAPLLRLGGTLIAWRGRREPGAEAEAVRAAAELGLGEPAMRRVRPYSGAVHRHLYVASKERDTPPRFPRRPGIALKRPLGAENPRPRDVI